MKIAPDKLFLLIYILSILVININFSLCEYKAKYISPQNGKSNAPKFAEKKLTKELSRYYLPHEPYFSSNSYTLAIDVNLVYYGDYIREDYDKIKIRSKHHPKVIGTCAHFVPKKKTPKYTILVSFGGLDTASCSSDSVKFFRRFVNYVSHFYNSDFVNETQFIVIDWLRLVLKDDKILTFTHQMVDYYISNPKKRDVIIPAVSTASFLNKLHRVGIIPSMSDSAAYGICIGGLNIALASLLLNNDMKVVVINASPTYKRKHLKKLLDNSINREIKTKFIVISGKKDLTFNRRHGKNLSKLISRYSKNVDHFEVDADHRKLVMSYYFTSISFIASSLLNRECSLVYMSFKNYPKIPKSFYPSRWLRYVMYDQKLHAKYDN